jgi:hypothetical protein
VESRRVTFLLLLYPWKTVVTIPGLQRKETRKKIKSMIKLNKLLFAGILTGVLCAGGCRQTPVDEYQQSAADPQLLHVNARQLTELIIFDVFKLGLGKS